MVVSYLDKKKKTVKNVIVLTTMSDDQVLTSQDKRLKHSPIVFYDHTEGGVDVVDLIVKKMKKIVGGVPDQQAAAPVASRESAVMFVFAKLQEQMDIRKRKTNSITSGRHHA